LAAKLARLRQLIEQSGKHSTAGLNLARNLRVPGGREARETQWTGDGDEPLPVEVLVPGTETDTPYGPCFLAQSVLPLEHRHGRWPLGHSLKLTAEGISWLSLPSAVEGGDLARAVFVDVETTGLAGGTGTIPFLVGLGFFEGDAFVIHQYLMRGPEEERAVLSAVAGAAGSGSMVVSFNGKAFDLPLLETRFILNRMRFPFPPDHLDLLFASRRVWGLRLESCRLSSLEASVLGIRRWQDIPGSLIPQLYYDYLRTGDGRCLSPVFDHNLLDVLSLVSLAGRLGELHRDPLRALEDAPEDLFSVGRCFERAGRGAARTSNRNQAGYPETSLACYEEALAAGLEGPAAEVARLRLSLLCKRTGQRDPAVRHWEELSAGRNRPAVRLQALVELAKHHEHFTKDLAKALECVAAAEGLAASRSQQAALRRRKERLLRKQSSTSEANINL